MSVNWYTEWDYLEKLNMLMASSENIAHVTMNENVRVCVPWCVCPAVGLLGRIAVLFSFFKGISALFSIVAVLVCIPTKSVRGFPFLHTFSSIY